MKNECERTRRKLPDYLRGHVFRITRNRIDRHLQDCVVCRSECEALKSSEETRQLLKYIDSPGGVAHRVKEGVSALTKLRKILYRPLWLAGIVLVAAGITYYAMLPSQLNLEIESIVKTAPATTTPAPAAESNIEAAVVSKPVVSVQRTVKQPIATRAVAPLTVSITAGNETSSIQRINEVMAGHEELRNMKFSDTERRLSGRMTAEELLTFFDRLREVAKVRYDRKRFKSIPDGQPVPFVLMLKAAPRAIEKPMTGPRAVRSAETHTPAVIAPAPPVSAPATSATK
jgi:hypothetical protein